MPFGTFASSSWTTDKLMWFWYWNWSWTLKIEEKCFSWNSISIEKDFTAWNPVGFHWVPFWLTFNSASEFDCESFWLIFDVRITGPTDWLCRDRRSEATDSRLSLFNKPIGYFFIIKINNKIDKSYYHDELDVNLIQLSYSKQRKAIQISKINE